MATHKDTQKDTPKRSTEERDEREANATNKRDETVLAADEQAEPTGLAARPPHLMAAPRQVDGGDTFVPAPTHQVITQMDVRSDADALTGHFVQVIGGEHEGVYGVLDFISAVDKDGKPLEGVVVTRDENATRIVCKYTDLRRTVSGRR